MVATPSAGATDEMLRRIHREYLEMPGLCLTLEQAQRFWGLDAETCRDAIRRLVDARFLCEAVVDEHGLSFGPAIVYRRLQPIAMRLEPRAAA